MIFLSRDRVRGPPSSCNDEPENLVEIQRQHISEWDFTKQNLQNAYGHLLSLHIYEPPDEGWYGRMWDTLPEVIECTARHVLREGVAIERGELEQGFGVKMMRGDLPIPLVVETNAYLNIRDIRKRKYPLQKMAALCFANGTRYGAISTGEGLIAVCVVRHGESVGVRVRLADGTRDFTLWCLAMMALKDREIKQASETPLLGKS